MFLRTQGLAALLTCITCYGEGFQEVSKLVGIDYTQSVLADADLNLSIMTGGAAAGDFDGDGWIDIYVTRLGQTDILYRNTGGDNPGEPVGFEEMITTGIEDILDSNGAAWGDIDKDGDLDLFVTTITGSRYYLYINNGSGFFKEEALSRGTALESPTDHEGTSVSFGDYDKDGWLDIHTTEWGLLLDSPDIGNHQVLLKNMGASNPGHFTNVTQSAGVVLPAGTNNNGVLHIKMFGFTSEFTDLDNDGWPDLIVASDFTTTALYWNNGDGTFTNGTQAAEVAKERSAMGSVVGDYNNDGLLDWFVTSDGDTRLYKNLGNRKFEDVTDTAFPSGIPGNPYNAITTLDDWGWGAEFLDFDNDGDLDIVMANGYVIQTTSEKDKTRLFRNDDGVFKEISQSLGIDDIKAGKALLTFDYDRDGDLDFFIANTSYRAVFIGLDPGPSFFRNDLENDNKWLRVTLKGDQSTPEGLGARLTIISNNKTQMREMTGGSRYLSQSERVAHFGLGELDTTIESLQISWPSGQVQIFNDLSPNQDIVITEQLSYQNWLIAYFSPDERNTPALVAKDSDNDNDGISNFFEYTMNSSPKVMNEFVISQDLQIGSMRVNSETVCRLNFERPTLRAEARYVYETSNDLANWEESGTSSSGIETREISGNDRESVTVDFSENTDSLYPLFIRIRIEEI